MKRLFLDTNIVIDFLLERQEWLNGLNNWLKGDIAKTGYKRDSDVRNGRGMVAGMDRKWAVNGPTLDPQTVKRKPFWAFFVAFDLQKKLSKIPPRVQSRPAGHTQKMYFPQRVAPSVGCSYTFSVYEHPSPYRFIRL